MMIRIGLRRLGQFRRDENGVVLILFILMFVPILLVVAVAVDYSQVLVIKRQLTGAVDAAALTVAQMPDLDDEEARAKAENFIRAHYPDASIGSLMSFNVVRSSGTVDVTAAAEMPTSFLRIAGQDKLEVTVSSRAMMHQSKLEIVMVLDNTGSMDDKVNGVRKMDALKTAANTLVTTLFGNAAESAYVKIGLVPFALAVNVGKANLALHPDWFDTAAPRPLNTEQVQVDAGYTHVFQLFTALQKEWKGCVRARLGGLHVTDTAPADAAGAQFTPYFAPDEPVVSNNTFFSNNYLNWSGSTELRYKKFSFYKNFPDWNRFSTGGPNDGCPDAQIQPLTNVKSTITDALTAMQPKGGTVVPEGLAWGWRVISPGKPFTEGVPYDDPETIKVIILLTDGKNDVGGGRYAGYGSVYSAFGYAENGHIGRTDGGDAEVTLNGYTATLCQSIKANKDDDATDEDIVIYSIGFDIAAGSTIDTAMRNCASAPSKYFNAPSTDQLQGAFESIALGLTKLRLAR
jgi:Flp pilus assembly protein TadG